MGFPGKGMASCICATPGASLSLPVPGEATGELLSVEGQRDRAGPQACHRNPCFAVRHLAPLIHWKQSLPVNNRWPVSDLEEKHEYLEETKKIVFI